MPYIYDVMPLALPYFASSLYLEPPKSIHAGVALWDWTKTVHSLGVTSAEHELNAISTPRKGGLKEHVPPPRQGNGSTTNFPFESSIFRICHPVPYISILFRL